MKKGPRPPCKPDTHLTNERKVKLESFLEEKILDCELSWDDLKEILQNDIEYVFDKKKKKSDDWFDDQDQEIHKLLKDKKKNV